VCRDPMDSLITTAAHALASGDPLTALNWIALREDPPALALRGVAMAQLGDYPRARLLLRRAARDFGPREDLARARCAVAEAEIALVSRDLAWAPKPLDSARLVLERRDDHLNAGHARILQARFLLLTGRLDDAERLLDGFDAERLPPPSRVGCALVQAGIAMRRLRVSAARRALGEAGRIASESRVRSLLAEVEAANRLLDVPAARLVAGGDTRSLRLDEVEALLASEALVIDACRRVVSQAGTTVSLRSRPVLFALARALAEARSGGASREALLARVFRAKEADESHRARLRVEVGRLRKALRDVAAISVTPAGFALAPRRGREVVVLAPHGEEAHGAVLALLGDGEAWSSTALALALGASQRTIQRALDALMSDGKVQAIGKGPARRWMAPPVPGFPTTLLLPTPSPGG
jgi:hypothetical protein